MPTCGILAYAADCGEGMPHERRWGVGVHCDALWINILGAGVEVFRLS